MQYDAAWFPDLPHELFFPHYWSKQEKTHFQCPHDMCMPQLSNKCKIFGNSSNSLKQFHWIPSKTHSFDLSSGTAKFWLFDKTFQNKYKHQSVIEHPTFVRIISDFDGDNNDSLLFPVLTLPNFNENLTFIHDNNAKQCGESIANDVKQLQE